MLEKITYIAWNDIPLTTERMTKVEGEKTDEFLERIKKELMKATGSEERFIFTLIAKRHGKLYPYVKDDKVGMYIEAWKVKEEETIKWQKSIEKGVFDKKIEKGEFADIIKIGIAKYEEMTECVHVTFGQMIPNKRKEKEEGIVEHCEPIAHIILSEDTTRELIARLKETLGEKERAKYKR